MICYTINKKLALAKSMLNSKVKIVYNSLEENVVINILDRCTFRYF